MVIFLHIEMGDDGRRNSKKGGLFRWVLPGSRSSPSDKHKGSGGSPLLPPRERRPLRSVPLVGPNYRVEPEILVSEFVEKEVKFLGTVSDLPCDFDATDRTSLLKIVDEQQTLKILPCQLTYKNDIIVSFSVQNIKLLQRDGEKLIVRIETHKIAAVGYVRDDNQHLVFIKFANHLDAKMCNLAVLCCDSKNAAEEVCSLAQQVFQLVYTDSTIDFLDKSIMDGAITPKNHSYSTDDSDKKDTVTVSSREYAPYDLDKSADSIDYIATSQTPISDKGVLKRPFLPRSYTDPLCDIQPGTSNTFPHPGRYRGRAHRRSGSSGSSINTHVTAASTTTLISPVVSTQALSVPLQLQDYRSVLKEQLDKFELKKFAELLRRFRTADLSIEEFSRLVLDMYTERRKSLLLGMRHFIPKPVDLAYFNQFLKENNVQDDQSNMEASPTSWWAIPPRTSGRSFSETEESTTSTSVNAGPATAISLSSSGSAPPSMVSNDDSGEWKDVLGNIEKMGLYPSTDSSAGPDRDAVRKTVNGTPPKHDSMVLQFPPILQETPVSQVHTPPVAAVPEGFRDSIDKGDVDQDPAVKSDAPIPSTSMKKDKDKNKKQSKADKKHQKRFSSSTDGLEQDSDDHSSKEKAQKLKKDKRKTSKLSLDSTGQGGTDFAKPPIPTKPPLGKPQKEHRKKKKHKDSVDL